MGDLLASVRMCWKLPPCLVQPVSDVFKKNMLLAEAGPIRNADNIFNILITYLRRKKNYWGDAIAGREEQSQNMSE